jgi:hypothetical protein
MQVKLIALLELFFNFVQFIERGTNAFSLKNKKLN